MNIKRAKEEIKHAVSAYLSKDEYGAYEIPAVRQRPILLMGPPGIGKTQIMEQIARECGIGLVAYTITHHTRQSAVGLPFIHKRTYGGREYSVTEYTMSEIIASVYEKIEQTGLQEGILFIDEINCVSETLAPTMLQFLQCKTFGNQKVPEGWIIAAAGNPPEYNKSVKEFDIVTLDRVKKIDVEEDFSVWKEYAYQQSIHGAVISYLDIKKENFYQIQTTVDGAIFATARGWEDLSQLIKVCEKLELTVDQEVVHQYIQHWKIAKDFANYLELYYKYRTDYNIEGILGGRFEREAAEKLKMAAFDEKLSVIGLILSRLGELFKEAFETDGFVTALHEALKKLKSALWRADGYAVDGVFEALIREIGEELELKKSALQIDRTGEKILLSVVRTLERYQQSVKEMDAVSPDAVFELVKSLFQNEVERRKDGIDHASGCLTYAFDFMEAVFGDSQEMVIFITELTVNYYSAKFIDAHGSDQYYRYNKGLLFSETQRRILKEIDEVRGLTETPVLD